MRQLGECLKTLKSGHNLYYRGDNDKKVGDIGFLVHKRHKDDIITTNYMSERVGYAILILNSRYNLKVTIAYAPTIDHEDQEVEAFYENIKTELSHTLQHNLWWFQFRSKIREYRNSKVWHRH